MITDLTRALSLALRLFLNMAIGEIVIAVFAYLGGLLAPASILSPIAAVPFTLLELGVGALQAYIFVILAVNYLAISVNGAGEHAEHDLTEDSPAETMSTVAQGAKGRFQSWSNGAIFESEDVSPSTRMGRLLRKQLLKVTRRYK
jgi:hypothetical protein